MKTIKKLSLLAIVFGSLTTLLVSCETMASAADTTEKLSRTAVNVGAATGRL